MRLNGHPASLLFSPTLLFSAGPVGQSVPPVRRCLFVMTFKLSASLHRSLSLRILKVLNLRSRAFLLLSFLFFSTFLLGILSVLQPAARTPSQPHLSNQFFKKSLTPLQVVTTPPLIVVVILPSHTVAQVHLTLRSLHDLNPPPAIHLLHYTQTPDPTLQSLSPNYTLLTSRQPYEYPLHAPPPDHPAPLLLLAGFRIAPRALSWLSQARAYYSTRPDVAAFVLDDVRPLVKSADSDADNGKSPWTSVNIDSSSPAFLFRACPRAAAIMPNFNPPHFDPWPVFSEWLTLRRGDWYQHPSGPGIDGTPFVKSHLTEAGWTPWTVWFTKFLHEYKLSVVYPNLDGALVLPDSNSANGDFFPADTNLYNASHSWSFKTDLKPFLSDGSLVPNDYFSEATIREIVDYARNNGGVIAFTLVNNVFIDTARSWLCNVDLAKFRPKGLLWAVTDVQSNDVFSKMEGCSTVWLNEVRGGKATGHEFGNPGYWKLMLERTELITEMLANGVAIFAFETDAIWLEDPMPYIEELVQKDADIVGTINSRKEVSGNFFYLRPTLATRRVWLEITKKFSEAYIKERLETKKADSWTYIENDQSLLTNLVLRNRSWRKAYPLKFQTLDTETFVDGRWYKPEEGFYTSRRARKPVVINNNFVIGVKEKTERAKKFDHWFWDENQKTCMRDAVRRAVRKP